MKIVILVLIIINIILLIYSFRKYKIDNKIKEENKKQLEFNKELESKENCLVLCKTPNTKYFKNTLPLGETLEEISKNIFTLLRKVDDYKVDLVVIEGVEPTGLGLAIMNRLIRSCSHNYLELL